MQHGGFASPHRGPGSYYCYWWVPESHPGDPLTSTADHQTVTSGSRESVTLTWNGTWTWTWTVVTWTWIVTWTLTLTWNVILST